MAEFSATSKRALAAAETRNVDGGDGVLYVLTFLTNGISGSTRKVRNVYDRFAAEILALPSTDGPEGG